MNFLKKYILHSPAHYGVALGLNTFFVLLVLFLRGFDYLIYYVDAFGVAGGISMFFGALLLLSSLGAFYTFGYSFSTLRGERKYKDLYEYTKAKSDKQAKQQKIYMPYILVGLLFLIISAILANEITVV